MVLFEWQIQMVKKAIWGHSVLMTCTNLHTHLNPLNPLTAGAAYIRVFHFLLAHQVPHLKYGKDKMWHQPARFEKRWPPFCQIWIIFTHLKLWIASARHNFKWVKIQIDNLAVKGLSTSPYHTDIFVHKVWKTERFFQFEIIINVFIWI